MRNTCCLASKDILVSLDLDPGRWTQFLWGERQALVSVQPPPHPCKPGSGQWRQRLQEIAITSEKDMLPGPFFEPLSEINVESWRFPKLLLCWQIKVVTHSWKRGRFTLHLLEKIWILALSEIYNLVFNQAIHKIFIKSEKGFDFETRIQPISNLSCPYTGSKTLEWHRWRLQKFWENWAEVLRIVVKKWDHKIQNPAFFGQSSEKY